MENKNPPLSEKIFGRMLEVKDVKDLILKLNNFIGEHNFTNEYEGIIRIIPFEWEDFKKEFIGKELCEDDYSQQKYAPENSEATAESYNLRSETTKVGLQNGKTVNVSDNQTADINDEVKE